MGLLKDRVAGTLGRVILIAVAAATGATLSWSAPSAEKTRSAPLQEAFRKAVSAVRPKLGDLQPWQQLLFSSEVLPLSENFVREYRPQGAGYRIDVDETMIRNYLAYFAPRATQVDQPKFLARVEGQKDCVVCEEALPSLQRLLEARLASRGVKLVWVKDSELPTRGTGVRSSGEFPSLAALQSLQAARSAQGSVVLRVERSVQKDDESGMELHAEDRKFQLVFGFSSGKLQEIRKLEFFATDSTEGSSRRLLLEALGSLGAQVRALESKDGSKVERQIQPEVLIRVAGVRDYYLMNQLKSQAQLAMAELNPVLERKLSRGACVLAVRTKLSGSEIKSRLNGLAVGASKLVVGDILESETGIELEAEIK